ncbi:MAG: mechanosensitive ion channel domain-containing protein, partial [Candidatus Latescibacterota bacterium]
VPWWDLSAVGDEMRELGTHGLRRSPLIVLALLVLLLTWIATSWSAQTARSVLAARLDNALLRTVASRVLAVPVLLMGAYVALRIAGLTGLAVTVLGGTGLIGLIIGVAFRDIAENFLASLMISVQNPFATGDLIEVAGFKGIVQSVNTRSTLLMTLEGNHVQIPNATIYKETITNFTANPNTRVDFGVGIGYDDSIEEAQAITRTVLARQEGVVAAPEEEVVGAFVKLFYATAAFVPKEVCLPCDIEERETVLDWLRDRSDGLVEIRIPQRGDKFRLMKMAENNAKLLLMERRLKRENRKQQSPAAVQSLQRDLNLEKPPRHIEAMDISNIQGTDPVASMVCFIDGRPRKGEYRHFKITGIEGPNDFAMMHQVVTRRFKRLMEEGKTFPDLLLIDGGKGQLSSAVDALQSLGITNQPVIGLAKRLEEVFRPGLSDPQNIPKTSASLRLLQGLRDESHRFAITYHRKLRQKRTLTSELDDIAGIGPNRRKTLLRHFGSLKKVKEASVADLAAVDGISEKLAGEIFGALHQEEVVVEA